jgi:ketosteroid isomerase-like protein
LARRIVLSRVGILRRVSDLDNVDIIRRSWSAWMERDMDRASADWDPDIEWDITRHEDAPDTVHRGIAEVMQMIADWLTYFRAYELIVESYEPAGDNVMLLLRRRARDRTTGENADRMAAHVWTLRDGHVVLIRSFSDITEARREAGLA